MPKPTKIRKTIKKIFDMKLFRIFSIILFSIFLSVGLARAAENNYLPDSKQLESYIYSLGSDSPIVLYAKEFLKRGISFNVNNSDTLLNLIIPKIFEFENESNIPFFFIAAPTDSDTIQFESSKLKFEYTKTKNSIDLSLNFIGNYKSDAIYFSLFEIKILSMNKSETAITKNPLKKALLRNNTLLQIKINDLFSIYKVYDIRFPVYFIGAATKYQGQNVTAKKIENNTINTFILSNPPIVSEVSIQTGVDSFNISELKNLPAVGKIFIPEIIVSKEKYDTLGISSTASMQIIAETSAVAALSVETAALSETPVVAAETAAIAETIAIAETSAVAALSVETAALSETPVVAAETAAIAETIAIAETSAVAALSVETAALSETPAVAAETATITDTTTVITEKAAISDTLTQPITNIIKETLKLPSDNNQITNQNIFIDTDILNKTADTSDSAVTKLKKK